MTVDQALPQLGGTSPVRASIYQHERLVGIPHTQKFLLCYLIPWAPGANMPIEATQWAEIVTTAVLIGIGSNLDNTSVGIAYGVADVRVPHRVNAIINAIGFVSVTIACFAADMTAQFLAQRTAS